MADIVSLAARREEHRLIWVCNCGCTSHRAYADGEIRCASCEEPASGLTGDWRLRLPPAPPEPEEVGPEEFRVVPIESGQTFLRRNLKEDIVAGVLMFRDGGETTYSEGGKFEGERAEWLKRKLGEAQRMMLGQKRA